MVSLMNITKVGSAVTCSVFSCKMLRNCGIIVYAGNFLWNLLVALMFPVKKKDKERYFYVLDLGHIYVLTSILVVSNKVSGLASRRRRACG
ncbi:hypothetical protein L6452_28148 [Arctium lappa]|uniref:Uncharacterized protein n=1 Tax=Arctium lappa TaxID=4217 RepID=A0ACB8ZXP0_ARCLA|nr:hypothetical protein L6452_28148 [Arctium lappa]